MTSVSPARYAKPARGPRLLRSVSWAYLLRPFRPEKSMTPGQSQTELMPTGSKPLWLLLVSQRGASTSQRRPRFSVSLSVAFPVQSRLQSEMRPRSSRSIAPHTGTACGRVARDRSGPDRPAGSRAGARRAERSIETWRRLATGLWGGQSRQCGRAAAPQASSVRNFRRSSERQSRASADSDALHPRRRVPWRPRNVLAAEAAATQPRRRSRHLQCGFQTTLRFMSTANPSCSK